MLAKTHIGDDTYLRQRLAPIPGDPLYLHLSDLLLGLRLVSPAPAPARVLDFGCGGSPYRELFPGQPYHRADFAGFSGLDFEFGEDSSVSAPSASYDLVLSTQVLEHVRTPSLYLSECHRLLRSGGRLVLSTHGTFEDHGCPYDFQRWTADGLRVALEQAGFRVLTLRKLTCGPRALVFLARMLQPALVTGDRTALGYGLRVLQRMLRRHPRAIDAFCDRAFPSADRICEVSPDRPGPTVYIGLLVEAEPVFTT